MTRTETSSQATIDVLLRDGTIASIGPVTADDERDLRALNAGVSLRTRRLRYFSDNPLAGERHVDHLIQTAPAQEALLVRVGGAVVGLASAARTEADPTQGELGLLVDDEHQHLGIGQLLLEHLAQLARYRGLTSLTAEVLSDNTSMLRLLRDSGFTVDRGATEGGVTTLKIDLTRGRAVDEAVTRREIVAEVASLTALMRPRGIAVVGSPRPHSVASEIWRALEASQYRGFLRRVGPGQQVGGGPVIDLVVAAVPAKHVLEVAADAARGGARALVVVSAGFAEAGDAGAQHQAELLDLCRHEGMRLIGPNCLGIVSTDPDCTFNATFCDAHPRPGGVALISQSGAVGLAALRHAERRGAGLSAFVSTGNKADVSGNDLIAWFSEDDRTSAIALYLESFGNPSRFLRIASEVGRRKPLIVVKSGRTAAGAMAGRSHTAAAATPAVAVDALLRRAGAIRARDLNELFDVLTLLDDSPLPRGRRVAVIGNSGGPGVLAADACVDAGLELATLSEHTQSMLTHVAPQGAALGNPIDLLATVDVEAFEKAVQLVAADPGVDAVVTIYTPLLRGAEERYAAALARVRRAHHDVPIVATFPGVPWAPAALPTGMPFFELPEPALHALGKLADYVAWRDQAHTAVESPVPTDALSALRTALLPVVGDEPRWLSPTECQHLLQRLGIPTARIEEVTSLSDAERAATALGYPVALKANGPSLLHKSRSGGVVLDIRDRSALQSAYRSLQSRLGERVESCVVQAMAPETDSIELLIGMVRDPSVGPLVATAAGGTLTDVLDDRAVRLPATGVADALEQLASLRVSAAFPAAGARAALDVHAAADVLLTISALAREVPEIAELDINPLLVSPEGVCALDVRVQVQSVAHSTEGGRALSTRTVPAPRTTR